VEQIVNLRPIVSRPRRADNLHQKVRFHHFLWPQNQGDRMESSAAVGNRRRGR